MEDLITKKELLEITGISYGALYRWKRMKLLPDQWFIHRSTSTGHETFFPRKKVLMRISNIQNMKETMSLEEIARHFGPGPAEEVALTPQEAAALGIAPAPIIHQYMTLRENDGSFDYLELLGLYTFSALLMDGSVSREEAYEVSAAVVASGDIQDPVVYLLRKYGVAFCVTASEMQQVLFDSGASLAASVSVSIQRAGLSTLLGTKNKPWDSPL